MAVFTKVSDSEFASLLKNYNIGEFKLSKGISEGVENTNYIIETTKNKFIFTIYEDRVDVKDLPFFLGLQKHLNASGFLCPKPVANKAGDIINHFKGKCFSIVSFIQGKWPKTITNNEVKKASDALAKLHNASTLLPSDLSRGNSMNKDFWLKTYESVKEKACLEYKELELIVDHAKEIINKSWPSHLPKGIIHADYFPDNVMFNNDKVSGVIDFYMACEDIFAYDLAIALNAWCFEKDDAFNVTKAKIFLNNYNNERNLSNEELEMLPTLCIGASLRFLSTRLYDKFKDSEGATVTAKDPKEYIEKLKFHLQVSSFSDYGI